MTPTQKSQIRVGIITAVVGGLLLLTFSTLGGQVILRPEFEASQTRLETKIERVEGITKDILCSQTPNHWRCS